jgi:hypothetical protein
MLRHGLILSLEENLSKILSTPQYSLMYGIRVPFILTDVG